MEAIRAAMIGAVVIGIWVAFLAACGGFTMWMIYLWKVEVQPLVQGKRWRLIKVIEHKGKSYPTSYYDWVDPATYKGPGIEPPEGDQF